jgi:serine/threonine protein phosphatase PrpC
MTDQPEQFIYPVDPDLAASKWVVLSASVQGTRHIQVGLPCEDSHAYRLIDESTLVAAVADGLGSAVLSQVGSELATRSVVAYLAQELRDAIPADEAAWLQLARDSFQAARDRLVVEARANEVELRDYNTTLILAVWSDGWLVTGHIGDGAIVALLEDGDLDLISSPQNDEYANVTYPLTIPDMLDHAEFKVSPIRTQALALLTDGMQHASIRTLDQTPHQPFFEPLFRQLPGVKDMRKASQNLAEFMASKPIITHSDDDKTLMLIGRQRG